MVYDKNSEGWPNVGRYFACRRTHPITREKGRWVEPLGSYLPFLDNPEWECVMYDSPEDKLPD